MKLTKITPEFVKEITTDLKEGILYISEEYGTCIHKCCCGCQQEVVTPISKGHWKLLKDNDLVSLKPSIGNYQYPCKSHYFIQENKVIWC